MEMGVQELKAKTNSTRDIMQGVVVVIYKLKKTIKLMRVVLLGTIFYQNNYNPYSIGIGVVEGLILKSGYGKNCYRCLEA